MSSWIETRSFLKKEYLFVKSSSLSISSSILTKCLFYLLFIIFPMIFFISLLVGDNVRVHECSKEGSVTNFLKLLVWFFVGEIWERRERKCYLFYLISFNYLFSLFWRLYIFGNLTFYLLSRMYFFWVLFRYSICFLLWLNASFEWRPFIYLLLSCFVSFTAIFYLFISWKYLLAFWFINICY